MGRLSSALADLQRQNFERTQANPVFGVSPSVVPAPVSSPVRPEVALSTVEACALLSMSREVADQAIYRAVQRQTGETLDANVFKRLVGLGLAIRPEGERYHRLTAAGHDRRFSAGRDLIREHQIHAPYIHRSYSATGTVRCTCGWSAGIRVGDHTQANAIRAFSRHIATIEHVKALAAALAKPDGAAAG